MTYLMSRICDGQAVLTDLIGVIDVFTEDRTFVVKNDNFFTPRVKPRVVDVG